MPKVSSQHFEDVKSVILDAALAVSKKKPIHDITMKDIVIESGLSRGGVYQYFSNIDDVLAALINRVNSCPGMKEETNRILTSSDSPETVVTQLFSLAAENISRSPDYCKIYFEITTLYANNPEREKKARRKINAANGFDFLIEQVFAYICRQIQEGHFQPVLPVEEIFSFLIASFDGIMRDVTLSKCYPSAGQVPPPVKFDEKSLTANLSKAVLFFLGA